MKEINAVKFLSVQYVRKQRPQFICADNISMRLNS